MSADRYVLLGLARPRAEWFSEVARWATSAAIPAEFLKCVSAEEVRARLGAARPYSAVLLDGSLPGVDRDLLQTARDAGCIVVIVDDGRSGRDWGALGAAIVLLPSMTREVLLDALASHATMVGRGGVAVVDDVVGGSDVDLPLGAVAAVCGPGGTGASTVAAALAQGLGATRRYGRVLLADLALHAEQAMLHDVRDIVPGIQEVVEGHRARRPGEDELLSLTFEVVARDYHLLLGLRRARYWSTLRRRSFEVAFESLRRHFGVTVCDITADFEGEDDGGSADVEERNQLARTAVLAADVVFVVGRPGAKGVHALVRVLGDLAAAGVPAGRVVPVINLAPRHPRARAEISAALADLAAPAMAGGTGSPLFLPARRVEEAVRDVVALPAPLPTALASAFEATRHRLGPTFGSRRAEPQLVTPGSIGSWLDEEGVG
jgi:septum formation inhibitor-activating ATPase MinD